MSEEKNILSKALGANSAEIYLYLAKKGESTVPEIVKNVGLSRAVIYDCLSELLVKDFLDYHKDGRSAYYSIKHPLKLKDLAEDKKRESNLFADELNNVISNLTGSYNMLQNKPGVRFFSGEEGLKEVWWDSLRSKSKELWAMGDLEGIIKNFEGINAEWLQARKKKGMLEKIITNPSDFNIKYKENEKNNLEEIKFIDTDKMNLKNTMVDIYDGKVAYTTLEQGNIIGVILQDKNIYNLQKNIFNLVWDSL
ncbi:MAG: hypothetical protein HOA57_03875 [Candidatus Magasanikbacteria bacterium]|jgi:HTH-type transcriptional regulator, sugar sensing transcriptional regulator|nr:hypothetical protein [Candidatus Magasanikbacteria bacterium]MBT4315139.1 hypothetical protein [Candidatus Magasanikbacteria bacterium]MBT4547405.1 hypothetical protein [Candidatus Magasanikbacteria bacterium]MBT6819486.1 hypothetical protein [Candidatus Magasanikbacteria bacterium]